ncbi:MAG: hypothetical protein V4671_03315 [Armatimonadota bacterium]
MLKSINGHRFLRQPVLSALLVGIPLGMAGIAVLRDTARAAPQTGTVPKQRKLDVKMDDYNDNIATGIRTLMGNVQITSDDTVMRTALAQYNTKTGVAVAPGTIQINDERNTLVGNSGKAYYKKREAIIQGAVRIVVRPKPGSASAPKGSVRREFKDPVTVFCDQVVYDWRNRVAVATGHLTLKQITSDGITRTATAKKLTYNTRNEELFLQGDVNAVDSKGQKLKGPEATAIIREGAEVFRMKKGATAEIYVEDEDEPTAAPTPLLPAPVTVPTNPATTPVVPPTAPPPPEVTPGQ